MRILVIVYLYIQLGVLLLTVVLAENAEVDFVDDEKDHNTSYNQETDATLIVEEDSDYLFLYTGASTLPYLENEWGVFAKFDIPKGEIICEHRGKVVRAQYLLNHIGLEPFITYLNDGSEVSIVGNEVCAFINDAAYIIQSIDADGKVQIPYTTEQLVAFSTSEDYDHALPVTPGYAYNSMYHRTRMGKVIIMAITDIRAGDEIFFPYGLHYWLDYLKTMGGWEDDPLPIQDESEELESVAAREGGSDINVGQDGEEYGAYEQEYSEEGT